MKKATGKFTENNVFPQELAKSLPLKFSESLSVYNVSANNLSSSFKRLWFLGRLPHFDHKAVFLTSTIAKWEEFLSLSN